MIEQGIRTLLISDPTVAALIGVRAYSNFMIQNPTLPAIVITKISGEDRYSTTGSTGPSTGRWQIDCYGNTVAEARELSDAIKNVLSGYKGAAGDETIQGSFLENEIGSYDFELKTYRRKMDFIVNYKES
jgi:hypothetical protein